MPIYYLGWKVIAFVLPIYGSATEIDVTDRINAEFEVR
jgi:hypothetical protein